MFWKKTKKEEIPAIGSEGGPILIGDLDRIKEWRGIEAGGSDYDSLCDSILGKEIYLADSSLIAWDISGAGVVHMSLKEREITLIRF